MLMTRRSLSSQTSGMTEGARSATARVLEKTGDLASEATRKVTAGFEDASAAAQYRLARCGRSTRRFVADRPVASAMIAAAAGAAVVALAVAIVRKRRERY